MFLKVSLKGLTWFGMKEKLKPRYIGPFEVLQRIGEVAYGLDLLPKLSHVHDVFHVTILRTHELNPFHMISFHDIKSNEDATYIEKPVRIATHEEKK